MTRAGPRPEGLRTGAKQGQDDSLDGPNPLSVFGFLNFFFLTIICLEVDMEKLKQKLRDEPGP